MSQKLLVVGDTHADTSFAQSVTAAATAAGCNYIVQLGDWDLSLSAGFRNVWISWLKKSDDRYVFWLDGNHDDHEYLKTVMAGHSGDTPIAHWHERLLYCPRGSVTKIDGVTLQFMGGAYSIDEAYRTPGRDWWPEETITPEQEQHAIDNGHEVDIFFSHDAPPSEYITSWLDKFGYKVDPNSEANRQAFGSGRGGCEAPAVDARALSPGVRHPLERRPDPGCRGKRRDDRPGLRTQDGGLR